MGEFNLSEIALDSLQTVIKNAVADALREVLIEKIPEEPLDLDLPNDCKLTDEDISIEHLNQAIQTAAIKVGAVQVRQILQNAGALKIFYNMTDVQRQRIIAKLKNL